MNVGINDTPHRALPSGFLFGAATSPHQTEGGNIHSDWWQLEHAEDSSMREQSGMACDSYHRWPEDMDLLAASGLNAYRFGIEWSRIEPEEGKFDESAIRHYADMVSTAHRLGIRPFVTLHHFTSPEWFSDKGGWASKDCVQSFLSYVDAILPILRLGVSGIVTINEPNMVAIMGRIRAGEVSFSDLEPGVLPEPDAGITANLIESHLRAVAFLHQELPGTPVGWSVANQCVEYLDGGEARAVEYSRTVEEQFILPARSDDFIGIQSYTRTVFGEGGRKVEADPGDLTSNGWEYYPQAVAGALRLTHQMAPQTPLIVTENGISTKDDALRIRYTETALSCIADLLDDGLPIRGYFHWSLLDNYEWGSWEPTFGLIAVDRHSGHYERTPKPSLAWLGGWASKGCLPKVRKN
ncbi:MAG: family 1 glycosylhydrolase [Bifidobacterium psychraerophilum]|uniref:glycoside hydrolase family 1 protein n=1 Tax=Bifidobacterium psychraerophilum TaxID=218140 RepID=UPI0039EA6E7E